MAKKQQSHDRQEGRLATEGYLDVRLGLVDKRFDDVDKRFDDVDKRFDDVDKRFDDVDKRFDDVDKRFDGMKIYIDERLFDTRKGLKEEIIEEIRGETAKILEAVDEVMTRFDRAEKEEAAHTLLHKRLADTLHSHDQRIGRLETRIKS